MRPYVARTIVSAAIGVFATVQVILAMTVSQEFGLVSYSLSSPITLREPVIVRFSVRNVLKEIIDFDLGHNRKSNFRITVVEPDGSVTRVPQMSTEGFGIPGDVSLKPGQTYSQLLLLNEWYGFQQPGKYDIEIDLAEPIHTASGSSVKASTSGHLSLEISPRDEQSLKLKCDELVKIIQQSPYSPQGQEAGLAGCTTYP